MHSVIALQRISKWKCLDSKWIFEDSCLYILTYFLCIFSGFTDNVTGGGDFSGLADTKSHT
jgi:hypothetical protein